MFGYCFKKATSELCLVTEFVTGGNLQDAIDLHGHALVNDVIIKLALSICSGMIFLHSKGIIHRDLKPANLLVPQF
jgi:serine/threonine protein kinase